MKRVGKILSIGIAAVSAFIIAAFVSACVQDPPVEEPEEYTITLYLNGEQKWDSFTGVKGSAIEFTKADPTRPNSNFKGWSLTLNGEVVELPETMPEENLNYYAVFTRYYGITLRAGLGTLSGETQINAEVNQNIYSLVKDIAPTAPGKADFDGWYYGNKKLDENSQELMPSNGITLTARYTIGYTINVFKQQSYKSDDYQEVTADKVTSSGFVGSSPLDSEYPAYEGYEINDEKSGSTSDFVLSADGGNVFDAYYNLRGCRLAFNSNLPDADLKVSGTMSPAEWGYDVENVMPECAYSINGYRFSYWSTRQDGSDRLDAGDIYKITDHSVVYAIWTKGYSDVYGASEDYIFIDVDAEGNKNAYLDRYYLDEIIGEYDETAKTFTFKDEDGTVLLHGIIDEDSYTFAYINSQAYNLHVLGDASEPMEGSVNTNVTMTLNDDGTAVYTDNGEVLNGVYSFEAAEGSMKFTSGETSFYFRLTLLTADGGKTQEAFEIRSEKEIGDWCRLTVEGEADANFVISLNGYGEAVMNAVSGAVTTTPSAYEGLYRFAEDSSDEKLQIYAFFITSGGYETPRLLLIDNSENAAKEGEYSKFYKQYEYGGISVYEKPADGAALDINTANKITLDGYGIFGDSAQFAKNGQTVNGKYVLNMANYTLSFDAEGTENDVEYFIDIVKVGDGDGAKSYLVYEEKENKSELDEIYAITGLEKSFVPGRVYGFRFFNRGVARLYVLMPDINQVFNTINLTQIPVIDGTYESTGVSGEYLFKADITSQQIALIAYYYNTIFNQPLDISKFGDFKFRFTGRDDKGYQAGEVTALGDGYGDITVSLDGVQFTTDGYGKVAATVNGNRVEREYQVLNTMGLPCLYVIWKEIGENDKEVTKQEMFTLIDGEYRHYVDEYGKHNTQYSSQVIDTAFRIVVYEGDYAVLAYNNASTRSVTMYSWGKVTWDGAEKKFGKYTEFENFNSSAAILNEQFGDFKFGIKEVTVQSGNDTTTELRIFVFDANADEIENGKFVINGEDGSTLTIDLNKGEAEYAVPDENADGGKTVISGEFKFAEGIFDIVYAYTGEEDKEFIGVRSFKLVYEGEKITSFKPVGIEAGTWQDATGVNGNLVLSGEAVSKGVYSGTFRGYDYDNDTYIDVTGTYERTVNEGYEKYEEYLFKYTQEYEAENEDGGTETLTREVSFRFVVGYSANRMPIYRIFSQPVGLLLYGSISSTQPVIKLEGGGYNNLVATNTSNAQLVGQLVIYPNYNLFIENANLFAFANFQREIQFFFTLLGEGENVRAVILDGTFAESNFGRFECDGTPSVTIPVKNDGGEYEDVQINVKGVVFNGLGSAMLVTDDDRAFLVLYARYTTSTYVLMTIKEDKTPVLIAQFRLYAKTEEAPAEGEGEPSQVTRYIIRFADAEMNRAFKGAGLTAFITDGFDSAAYTDANGALHSCTFERVAAHPEVVCVRYLNGFSVVTTYIELNFTDGTFTVLDADDSRIPQENNGGEENQP